jgi:uncharacterized protein YggE
MRTQVSILLLCGAFAVAAAGSERLIRVNGDARVEAKPDYAVVRLNLEARDRLLKRARSTHELDVSSVLKVASRYKIAAADIAQDFPEIESRGDGFLLRRTIQLTVRDLQTYDAMLFDLYDSAAVTVETVEFRVNDLRKLRDQAREMAIRAAEEKVQLMAAAMKRRVGRVMDVRVETGGGTLLRRRGQSVHDDGSRPVQNISVVAGAFGGSSGGAELFRVPITANVDVQYEIFE